MKKLDTVQQQIVTNNLGLVHHIVRRLGINPNHTDYEDMVSIGVIGLMKASTTYDSQKNAFSTYAYRCIENEILMFLRKSNRYVKDISIYQPIRTKKAEFTLEAELTNSDFSFLDKVEEECQFVYFLSIILNYLNRYERLVMLYWLKNVNQAYIGNMVNISQRYVSTLLKRAICKIKEVDVNRINYNEKLRIEIIDNAYRLTFKAKDINDSCPIYESILSKITLEQSSPQFRVRNKKGRIIIDMPAQDNSFLFIAQVIQEIDKTDMKGRCVKKL